MQQFQCLCVLQLLLWGQGDLQFQIVDASVKELVEGLGWLLLPKVLPSLGEQTRSGLRGWSLIINEERGHLIIPKVIWVILYDPPVELLSLLARNEIMSQYFSIEAMVLLMRFLLLEWRVVCIEHFGPLSCRLESHNAGCLYQLGLTHALTRQLADPSLMNLTVLQAILDHPLESGCRSRVGILIYDVRGVLEDSFPEDPIIVPFQSFLDLQPVQSFQILSFIQKAPQVYLGWKVDTQFMRGPR